MIRSTKIKEWINEIEERPMIAPFLVRRLSDHLMELDVENEALRSENLALKDGKKVEEYERKIADLEYQIEILKRQVKNASPAGRDSVLLLVYDSEGQVLPIEIHPSSASTGAGEVEIKGEFSPEGGQVHLLIVERLDELLFLYDSGRVATRPAAEVVGRSSLSLDWKDAYSEDLRGREELAAIVPITMVSFADQCAQVSRRGFVRSFTREYFQSFIARSNVGSGVKSQPDRLFQLVLHNQDDIFAVSSMDGYAVGMPGEKLPVNLTEMIRLGFNDHLVSAFTISEELYLVFVTGEGKAFRYETSRLSILESPGRKGRSVLSKKDREAGVTIVGAAAFGVDEWGAVLSRDGVISFFRAGDLTRKGAFITKGQAEVIAFARVGALSTITSQ